VKLVNEANVDPQLTKFTVENQKRKAIIGLVHHQKGDFCNFLPYQNVVIDRMSMRDLVVFMKRIQEKLDKETIFLNRFEMPKVPGTKTRKFTVGIGDKIKTRRVGLVKWHSPAREYCYFPWKDVILKAKELREIFLFATELDKERKEMK
jgi:hypothetical protein